MKIGVISDIHANLPALKATLEKLELEGVDEIVCLGDVIGVLGSPKETLEIVQDRTSYIVYGNHDARIFPDSDWKPVHDFEIVEYWQARAELSEEDLQWLMSLPETLTVYDDVTLAHAHPTRDSVGLGRKNVGIAPKDVVEKAGAYLDGGTLLTGHTHFQHAVNLDKFDGQSGLALNPGSVGFPFDYEWEQSQPVGKASFATLNPETQQYELLSTEYDSSSVVDYLEINELL